MGLFDKKYCDICGEKIGLLGNRKLEDGNLCKDCARKLSPLFSDRRNSTVEEIRQQLIYREENERKLADFRPDSTFGEYKKVYVDRTGANFIVTSASNWRNANPDLLSFSQVTGVNTSIRENKTELYYNDEEGKRRSYVPRRFEYSYEFNMTILVNSPWFDKIELELSSGNRPDSPYTDLYRHYEKQMHTLYDILLNVSGSQGGLAVPHTPQNREQEMSVNTGSLAQATPMMENTAVSDNYAAMPQGVQQSWICPYCGSQNFGKFCGKCGAPGV